MKRGKKLLALACTLVVLSGQIVNISFAEGADPGVETVIESTVSAEEEAARKAAEEEAARKAAEEEAARRAEEEAPLTASLKIRLISDSEITEGSEIVLKAEVAGASREYGIIWETRARDAREDDEWNAVSRNGEYRFTATAAAEKMNYRFIARAENNTEVISGIWNFRMAAEPETRTEEPEAKSEEPAAEEPEEEPAEENEEEYDESGIVEIEELATPLGVDVFRNVTLTAGEDFEEVNVREDADGMSAISAALPENSEITVIRVDGDWAMVVADEQLGYIYNKDLEKYIDLPEDEEAEHPDKKVTIFSSRRSVMHRGEEVTLTSELEGFENLNVEYQWEYDAHDGSGYLPVEGANSDTCSFIASAETLSWDWRLNVIYN